MRISWIIFLLLPVVSFSQGTKTWKDVDRITLWTDQDWDRDLKTALDSLEWARQKAKENFWIEKEVNALAKLSQFMLRKLNNFERASFYVGEIKKIASRDKAPPEVASIYHNSLGILYYHEGIDRKRAFEEFKKSIASARKNGIQPGFSSTNNYALVLMKEAKYDEALKMLTQSRQHYLEKKNSASVYDFLSLNYSNIGICYIYKGKQDSAQFYFQKSLDYAGKSIKKEDDFRAYVYLGVFNQESKNYDKAISYFNEAKKLLWIPLNFSIKALLFESLADCYVSQSNFSAAHEHRINQITYADSLKQQGYIQQAFSLDYKFELDSIRYEQKMTDLKTKVATKSFQFKLILSISIFSIFLLLSLFIIYRLNKQKQISQIKAKNEELEKERIKQEAELEIFRKEEELIQANVALSVQKNELQTLKTKLQTHLEKSHDPEFDDLKHFLKQVKVSEKKNEQLKYLDHVLNFSSNAFYLRIKEKFPALTDDEMRLATLIRLNLSSDELTLVFNISASSLMTKRYRLRKKLNLHKDESLENLIMSI
jgi:tetratricopeptide (TPR) repeat protein